MGYEIKLEQGDACYVGDLTKEAKQRVWDRFVADGAGSMYHYAINDYNYFEWYFDNLCPTNSLERNATKYTYEQIMEEEMNKGYQLADGSWSSEYKIGDKFIVTDGSTVFTRGSIISFYRDDNTAKPCFKLVNGRSFFQNCDGEDGGYISWIRLTPYKEEKDTSKFDIKEFKIADLKTGQRVTLENGDVYTVFLNADLDNCHGSKDVIVSITGGAWRPLSKYSEDLSKDGENIVKVESIWTHEFNDKYAKGKVLWERPAKETPEQIRQRELREQYEATKKQLEELGKQIGVVE